jgi:two-component system sensor histidine kinase and response regulator WspE
VLVKAMTTNAGGPDPEILELFRAELDTHLPVLSAGLLDLEKGEVNETQIEAMMRAAHSIKGAARIVGIEPAVRVAHALEDCFSAAKSKKIVLSSDSVDVLLEGVDALQQVCQPGEKTGAAPVIESLLQRIGAVGAGKSGLPPVMPRAAAGASHAQEVPVAAAPASDSADIPLPGLLDEAAAASLRIQLADLIEHAPARISLDFSGVREISAAGMALVAAFAREAGHLAVPPVIVLRGMQLSLRSLWRVIGLEAVAVMQE